MEKVISENWDLDSLYPGGKNSSKLNELISQLKQDIKRLQEKIQTVDHSDTQGMVDFFKEMQDFLSASRELDDFMFCLYSVNVNDPDISKLMGEGEKIKADFESLQIDMEQRLARFSESEYHDFLQHEDVKKYQFYIKERKQKIADKLPIEMEKLINDLSINGFLGWEDYYEQMMGNLRIPIEKDGRKEELSIGQALSYAVFSSDRSLRQQAAHKIVEICAEQAESFATVLNRINGFRLDVYKQRGWDNVLKEAMEQNRINEQTVHTMVAALKGKMGIFHSFLQRKAQVMNLEKLAWYDTNTPSFISDKKIPYTEAAEIVITQFHKFSEKLGQFAERAFHEGWIEAEDRKGKMHGGFCATMPLAKQSRIFLTYTGSYQDIVTIAHELGHAYHNYILHNEPAFSQEVSVSVAETASTFTENLVLDAAIEHASTKNEKLSLLELKILNGLKYQVVVPAMFEFEQKLYKKRKQAPLTAKEISNLMDDTRNDLYGGIVDELNPYEWITIPHFFHTDLSFYNIPYTIGYLFSNGIYALSKEKGSQFPEQYDELLRNTGRMTVEQLAAAYLNQDIGKKDFWESPLQPTIDAINEYLILTEDII
ncbi:pepF/M3 family oligoendopeptidase [Scopulibacillus darangshiensis]|uniref:PepF/M3 family oligoendopeptidase n=1 Tax=Scopulibacillus darangshiensis TaxID=442528 RepID=A0A4R2NFG9_9BACL|nr:M3 family oligoendopeptidase [Scopulibacillus darangshiensis]TCP19928.1 pepF/M3 family oligoendopeptidase [Scopulibacillus darangshiensis]